MNWNQAAKEGSFYRLPVPLLMRQTTAVQTFAHSNHSFWLLLTYRIIGYTLLDDKQWGWSLEKNKGKYCWDRTAHSPNWAPSTQTHILSHYLHPLKPSSPPPTTSYMSCYHSNYSQLLLSSVPLFQGNLSFKEIIILIPSKAWASNLQRRIKIPQNKNSTHFSSILVRMQKEET